jgi:UDP-N-acetylmuramoyl-L-alanyl-D-glutamate--2,6-diaminopimelate ligase
LLSSKLIFPELINQEGFIDCKISRLSVDSRNVIKGGVYFAVNGYKRNGIDYIHEAKKKGASIVISEPLDTIIPEVCVVENIRSYMGIVASRFFNHPTENIHTFCVTGTNGKTSCVESIAKLLNLSGERCGYMSTIGVSHDGLTLESRSELTTQNSIVIQKILSEIEKKGINFASLEASSHGLDQKRLSGTNVGTAILTSFSHDHLDYHKSLQNYQEAKKRLFIDLQPKTSIIQIDNKFGKELFKDLKSRESEAEIFSVSLEEKADFQASCSRIKDSNLDIKLMTPYGEYSFILETVSKYMASNVICSIAALMHRGFNPDALIKSCKYLTFPEGRMEEIPLNNNSSVFIDFAHTPEALETSLKELNDTFDAKIWCVFGCGGDRDNLKRPMMGKVSEKYSDYAVITNDNPRTEDPEGISSQILSGIDNISSTKVILDRKEAIEFCLERISNSNQKNILLISGKGHESYQEINNKKTAFNDKQVVELFLQKKID